MLEGINIDQRIPFVSEKDKEDPKTTFILKPLSGIEMLDFSVGDNNGIIQLNSKQIKRYLQKSIVEVQNYRDDYTIDQVIDSLPIEVLSEIFNKIIEINNLKKEEEKN